MGAPGQDKAFVVTIAGGAEYSLQMDINGMCALEERVSADEGGRVTFQQIMSRIDDGDMRALRLVVWASLLKHHPEVDIDVAGLVATEVLQSTAVLALMNTLVAGASPAPEDAKALGLETANPQKARTRRQAGTGPRSTARRAGTESRKASSAG